MALLALALAALHLSSCARSDRHPVGGTDAQYCVPSGHVVAEIPWVPDDPPNAPVGFSFLGCWHTKEARCSLPEEVRGGSVNPASHYRSQLWRDLPPDSFFRREAAEPDASIEVAGAGDRVVLFRRRSPDFWLVWSRKNADAAENGVMQEQDELLASCRAKQVWSDGSHRPDRVYECHRHLNAGPYEVDYHFRSKQRIPDDIERLDTELVRAIEGWRC